MDSIEKEEVLEAKIKTEEPFALDIKEEDDSYLVDNLNDQETFYEQIVAMDPMEGTSPGSGRRVDPSDERSRYRKKSLTNDEALEYILCPNGWESETSLFGDSDDDDQNVDKPEVQVQVPKLNSPTDVMEFAEEYEQLLDINEIEIRDDTIKVQEIDEDDFPLATFDNRPKWRKADFTPPEDTAWKDSLLINEDWRGKNPLFFFNQFFDEDLIEYITTETNLYATQTNAIYLGLTTSELKAYIGILFFMSIVKIPGYRSYWATETNCLAVTEVMGRKRFEQIKRYIHFNNNELGKKKGEEEFDRLYKFRPIFEHIKNNCKKIPQEEHQAVDKQIIPTKVRQSLKMYNPNKPHKWGYKIISRAGVSGIIYDMEFYCGKVEKQVTEVGVSSGFALRMAENIPKNKNYKLFYDNWFSSIALARVLKEQGILTLATIGYNRITGCVLEDDNSLKKRGRGSMDHRIETNSNAIAIKWFDNKGVHLYSTYAGIEPVDTCRRWDGVNKRYIDIQRPLAVKEYNKFMGGVDLSDMLIELYRINFKSRKWYMRIFFHLLDMSVVNGWLLYRRTHEKEPKLLSLLKFKLKVASGLVRSDSQQHGRGRPSSLTPELPKKRKCETQPEADIRTDGIRHYPEFAKTQQRCKMCVKNKSTIRCMKCNVSLCFRPDRNCFYSYHESK